MKQKRQVWNYENADFDSVDWDSILCDDKFLLVSVATKIQSIMEEYSYLIPLLLQIATTTHHGYLRAFYH